MKDNGINFKLGTKFRSMVNNDEFEVVRYFDGKDSHADVKVIKSDRKKDKGKTARYSVKHLKQLLVTEI